MAARGSIAVRAVIALLLMVLFYALAAAAIAALLAAAWLLVQLVGDARGNAIIAVVVISLTFVVAAGVIAWSVLPRVDRFEPPGPEVTAREQPALFTEIERVARATGEAPPAHVYLVGDVNAFVTQRGGLMGLGSKRVMGVGLPLLRTLTVSELRAVLAHEMGHFYGGDTKLGPWIYKTRGSMIRTVVNLQKAGDEAASASESGWIALAALLLRAVRAPFVWFAKGFLRVSQAVSRAQEYSADAVAVRAEGAPALIEGLKKSHAAALAHQIYLAKELAPVVDRGLLPPVGEGFSRFLASENMRPLLASAIDDELAEGRQDPYDSHPPLRERVAAAQKIVDAGTGDARPETDARLAIELVAGAEGYESDEIRKLADRRLRAVAWADTGAAWIELWRGIVKENRNALDGLEVAALRRSPSELRALAREVHGSGVDGALIEELQGWFTSTIAAALAVRLADAGYALENSPGDPHRLVRDGHEVEPWKIVAAWVRGGGPDDALATFCAELGLDGPLVPAPASPSGSTTTRADS